MKYSPILPILLALGLSGGAALAQNVITQDGWEGFAVRDADNKFDRCILYNRTIPALNASPYEMVGITRDASDQVGLLAFFSPRLLTRGEITLRLKFDQRPAIAVRAEALSDFHASVQALDAQTLAALRDAKAMDISADGKSIHADLKAGAAVLDRLENCVRTYGSKT